MKKILILLVALARIASAEWIVGANVGIGKVKADLTYQGNSADATTSYIAVEARGGYQWEQVRALAFIGTENNNEDMVIEGEENAVYYGGEIDYIYSLSETTDLFAGIALSKGSKDFIVTKVDFNEAAIKGGALFNIGENKEIEIGIQFKNRQYEDYVGIDLDEKLISLTIGLNFVL